MDDLARHMTAVGHHVTGLYGMRSHRKSLAGRSPNRRIIGQAAAWSAPMAVAQIILAWVSLGFSERVDMQHERSVLHHFFAPYSEGQGPAECGSDVRSELFSASYPRSLTLVKCYQKIRALAISGPVQRCAFACSCTRCYFPAAACIASVIFCLVAGALLWRAALHMIHRVINRTLQRRLRAFLGLFVSGEHHKALRCFCLLKIQLSALVMQHCGSALIDRREASSDSHLARLCRLWEQWDVRTLRRQCL